MTYSRERIHILTPDTARADREIARHEANGYVVIDVERRNDRTILTADVPMGGLDTVWQRTAAAALVDSDRAAGR